MRWITNYIDRKIEERHEATIEEIRKDLKKEAINKFNERLFDTIKSIYEHRNNNYSHIEFKRNLHDIIRTVLKRELQNLDRRHGKAHELERNAQRTVNTHVEKKVNSEEFIDEIVERIKKKQL